MRDLIYHLIFTYLEIPQNYKSILKNLLIYNINSKKYCIDTSHERKCNLDAKSEE